MKTLIKSSILFLTFSFIGACSVTEKGQKSINVSFLIGVNKGGITENTDLTVVPDVLTTPEAVTDAYSGATHTGFNAGVHAYKPIRLGGIESGLDFMYNSQSFTYADMGNMYIGSRDFSVSQFMLPLTYNINLFKRVLPHSQMQLKMGYMAQLNMISGKGSGLLPEYSIIPFSNGAVFGISAYPFTFKDNSALGFYLDAYRGSQIYEDYYNQKSFEMPGSSFVKMGLRFRFK